VSTIVEIRLQKGPTRLTSKRRRADESVKYAVKELQGVLLRLRTEDQPASEVIHFVRS
jgi:hypothetical protein